MKLLLSLGRVLAVPTPFYPSASPGYFLFESGNVLSLIDDPYEYVVVIECDLPIVVEVDLLEILVIICLCWLDVFGGQVAIDQDSKVIPLYKAIVVFVSIGEDVAEPELDLAASVLAIVSDNSESFMQ